jgi:hypothetical protein
VKVLLVFPPHWHPLMPHLALPALTSYLRANGVEVMQRDLNVESFDRALSSAHLRATLRRLRKEEKRVPLKGLNAALQRANLEAITWAKREGQRIVADIDQAKATIRSERFFDVSAGREALLTLASLIKEAGLSTHVTLGSKLVTGWRELLPKAEILWELFDSAIAFEGEVALLRLIEALDCARRPSVGACCSKKPGTSLAGANTVGVAAGAGRGASRDGL